MLKKINLSKISIVKVFLIIFFLSSIIIPLIGMFIQIDSSDWKKVFLEDNFFLMLNNSLIYTVITTVIVVFLSLISAYLLNESTIKHKNIFAFFLTITMFIPSISNSLGIINIFGVNGFLDKIFGLKIEAYGFFGLVMGSFLYSFPVAFLMFYDTLKYQDKRIYEAASVLGIKRFRMFLNLTLPNIKTTIFSVIFTVFTMVFTDYGVPLSIAGKVKTLPVYLYQEVISRFNFSKGTIVGISLLIPALIAFIYDAFFKKEISTDIVLISTKVNKKLNIITKVFLVIIILISLMPTLSFGIMGFVKSFPNDMTFTLDNLYYVMKFGLFEYLTNSIIIAFFTSLIGTIIAFLNAYFTVRVNSKISKFLNFASIISMAIPGIVLGLSYVLVFKSTPIYNTIIILIIVNIIHFFASPYLMASHALGKLDHNFESIGTTLGIRRISIFRRVIVPNCISTILEMFSYFFVNSMITISAVSFLAGVVDMPISLLIPIFETQLAYEAAAIVSLIILVINLLLKVIIGLVKKGCKKYA